MVEVNDEESSYAIPGKLFDYLNSKRPIISIGPTDSEVAQILKIPHQGNFSITMRTFFKITHK